MYSTASIHVPNTGGLAVARLSRRGFTLVELAVVSMLAGLFILVVISAPTVLFRDRETLKSEARALAGFLESVRTQAAVTGRTWHVEYDLKQQHYFFWAPRKPREGESVVEGEEGSLVPGPLQVMPSKFNSRGERQYTVWIDEILLGDGRAARSSPVKLAFTPRGGGHWHYVYLTNALGEYYTIEINPFTGASDILPGQIRPEPPERLR